MMKRLSIEQIVEKKKNHQKITMLTAYDYPLASLIDRAGIDIILVGDSLANVILGLESTRDVGMEEMVHHAKAVDRAVKHSLLVGDMPFDSYQVSNDQAVQNAQRFICEAGCNAVKIEWFENCCEVAQKIIAEGIPVMGHVGLTPQTADQFGGFHVQGKEALSAKRIIQNAHDLQTVGCFSVVLECIPDRISEIITQQLSIPTIGIGAGVHCDGQVLVTHDLLGFCDRFHPKFVREYVDLKTTILGAISRYRNDVMVKKFPTPKHSYHIPDDELAKLTRSDQGI